MRAINSIIAQDDPERILDIVPTAEGSNMKRPEIKTLFELDYSHHPMVATAAALARKWKEERQNKPGLSMIYTGDYGIGKTHIAQAIYWSFRQTAEGVPEAYDVPAGRFYHAGDLLYKLAPIEDNNGKTIENMPISILIGIEPLVIIDDLGARVNIPYIGKDFQEAERHQRYFRFFNYCADPNNKVSVIITSNLPTKDGRDSPFAQHIGGRSWDRLVQMCSGYILDMGNVPSYREKLATS